MDATQSVVSTTCMVCHWGLTGSCSHVHLLLSALKRPYLEFWAPGWVATVTKLAKTAKKKKKKFFLVTIYVMDLRREQKHSFKLCEHQQAELERIEDTIMMRRVWALLTYSSDRNSCCNQWVLNNYVACMGHLLLRHWSHQLDNDRKTLTTKQNFMFPIHKFIVTVTLTWLWLR